MNDNLRKTRFRIGLLIVLVAVIIVAGCFLTEAEDDNNDKAPDQCHNVAAMTWFYAECCLTLQTGPDMEQAIDFSKLDHETYSDCLPDCVTDCIEQNAYDLSDCEAASMCIESECGSWWVGPSKEPICSEPGSVCEYRAEIFWAFRSCSFEINNGQPKPATQADLLEQCPECIGQCLNFGLEDNENCDAAEQCIANTCF